VLRVSVGALWRAPVMASVLLYCVCISCLIFWSWVFGYGRATPDVYAVEDLREGHTNEQFAHVFWGCPPAGSGNSPDLRGLGCSFTNDMYMLGLPVEKLIYDDSEVTCGN
jgi:hypothetical protein